MQEARYRGCRDRLCTFHLQGLDVKVWREYEDFVEELSERFPHEREGIQKFYGECWAVFNSLNSLELKSLEEPRYLLGGAHRNLHQSDLILVLIMSIFSSEWVCAHTHNFYFQLTLLSP